MTLKNTWANGEQFTATDANAVATAVNASYTKPGSGIPSTDLASAVQTSLGKADSAVQSVSSTSITDATTTGKAVLVATDAATARTALGVAYGTTSGTVAQGNDSRFTPASTAISDSTATGRALLTTTDASTARTTLGVAYGTTSGTVAQGNDSRITGAEQTSNKNANSGYCGLDSSGLVAAAQLPSYVDDVLEYANLAAFPGTGVSGKIYIAADTGKSYRWSGSVYALIVASPGSTDSVTEGSTNLYFTNARADARISGASGLLPVAGISATGTPSSTTYLRGDGSWQTVTSGISRSVSTITSNTTTVGGTANTDYVVFANMSATGDPSYASVTALLAGDGSNNSTTITDSSSLASNWTASGNAKLSTATKKYGTASISFDASASTRITASAATSNFAFGTSAFTIEFWLYLNNTASNMTIIDFRPTTTSGIYPVVYVKSGGTPAFNVNEVDLITGGSTLAASTWYHIAVSRTGTSTRLFINGTQTGSTYSDSNSYLCGTSRPLIGASGYDLTPNFSGFLDDVRITKSVGRYTTSFIPASAALFTTTGSTPVLTLPTAVSNTNQYKLKNIHASEPLNVATTSSQTVDGASSYTISPLGNITTLISDGANWRTI